MAKYELLTKHLISLPPDTKSVALTFDEVERIMGDGIPYSARKHLQHWDYTSPGISFSQAWHNAGFEAVMVDLEKKTVRFKRVSG